MKATIFITFLFTTTNSAVFLTPSYNSIQTKSSFIFLNNCDEDAVPVTAVF